MSKAEVDKAISEKPKNRFFSAYPEDSKDGEEGKTYLGEWKYSNQ